MRLVLVVPFFFALANCSKPGWTQASPTKQPQLSSSSAQLEAGRKIYNFRCYFCHGYSGNAQTVAASFLSPPPVDFTAVNASQFTTEYIVAVLRKGKPGTAMMSFRNIISDAEMKQVATFVVDEFVIRKAANTHYHTPQNGWPDHIRYKAAFPFATGEIPGNRPWEELTEEQMEGKRLFMANCVTCHDRGDQSSDEVVWETRPLSYPRNNYSHTAPASELDAITSASPYRLHDIPPRVTNMSSLEQQGQKLFNDNCAFCHGADGTGKNWIGSFLESHPRNLRDPSFMAGMTRARMASTIREGLPNTSMPAWKSVLTSEQIEAITAYIAKAFHPLRE